MGPILVEGVGGVSLAVDVVAPAPAAPLGFLLVHGLASNARLWDGVVGELAGAGFASAAVDLRGHGRSGKTDEGYDYETLCADLLAVMEAFEDAASVERLVAVGQSFGGNLVLELAARRPPALAGVACVDGGVIGLSRFATFEEAERVLAPPRIAGTPAAEMEQRLRAMHPGWPEAGIAGTMANFEVRADGTVAPWLTLPRHLAILRTMWESRPEDVYPRVDVPVLLLPAAQPGSAGAAWAGDKAAAVEAAAAALPDVQVRWFSPADHDVHAQQPRAVAEALLDRFAPAREA